MWRALVRYACGMLRLAIRVIETPLGIMRIGAVERADAGPAIVAMHFTSERIEMLAKKLRVEHGVELVGYEPMALQPVLDEARGQLLAFCRGERWSFDLPLFEVGTPFQRRVWSELRAIPFGTTISYRELAERVENPKGSQAVGQANGANPLAIIVPCHRVIASDGTMAGYAGGEDVQRRLLAIEAGGLL